MYPGVTLETIQETRIHPNADRLSLCSLAGKDFQFVTSKDQFRPGDTVLYFPIDSVLPHEVIGKLGLVGRLSGPSKNRVKTVKLRGEISQGIVAYPGPFLTGFVIPETNQGQYIAELLGVTKYEEPESDDHHFRLSGRADDVKPISGMGLGVYDLESADRNTEAVNLLMAQSDVYITEKLEGSNFSFQIPPEGECRIASRRLEIGPKWDNHVLRETATRVFTQEIITAIREEFGPNITVTLRGEIVGPGIQGNIYKLNTHEMYVFDVLLTSCGYSYYLCVDDFETFYDTFEITPVPVIEIESLSQWLNGKTVKEASDGTSLLNRSVMREGIVIRPIHEQKAPHLGRLILKQRSPQYLANQQ